MSPLRRLVRLLVVLLIAASLFVPAGTLAWPQAWLFLAEFVGGLVVTMGWLKRHDPELYHQRVHLPGRADQPLWDKLISLAIAIYWFAWIIFMAFDHRLGLSPMPAALAVMGAVTMPAGYLVAALALKANSFAATIVRLQPERGQHVIDTGPYALVRHPMYSGSILVHIGTALLLGSWIGLAMASVLVALLGTRVVLEERLLRQGLPGYGDYTARVRWRMIPGLW